MFNEFPVKSLVTYLFPVKQNDFDLIVYCYQDVSNHSLKTLIFIIKMKR